MYEMKVRNARGDILPLSGNKDYITRAEGLNDLTAAINRSKAAGMDGARKNSASLNERNIVLYIKVQPPVALNRNRLYKFFNPKSEIRFLYKNDVVDVYIDGTVETFNCEPFTFGEVAQISILCTDPYFHAAHNTVYEFAYITSLFEFPFSIAAEGKAFSEIVKITNMIVNHGDVATGVIIEFKALADQILNPTFYNLTTQKYISIKADMIKEDIIRIDTRKGHKSIKLIRDNAETNILNDMLQGSSWVDFIAGENEISYDADEGAGSLEVTVTACNLYMGV